MHVVGAVEAVEQRHELLVHFGEEFGRRLTRRDEVEVGGFEFREKRVGILGFVDDAEVGDGRAGGGDAGFEVLLETHEIGRELSHRKLRRENHFGTRVCPGFALGQDFKFFWCWLR